MYFTNEFSDSLSGGACGTATMDVTWERSGDSQESLDGGSFSGAPSSGAPSSGSSSTSEQDAVSAGGPPDWLVAAIEEDRRRSSAEYGLAGDTQQEFDGGSSTA